MSDETNRGPSRAPSLVETAAWLGLTTGLIELMVLLAQRQWNHVAMIGSLRLNQHYPWMIPASHLAIFVASGLAMGMVEKAWPKFGRPIGTKILAGMAVLAVLLMIRELNVIASVLLACGVAARGVPPLRDRFAPVFFGMMRRSRPFMGACLVLLVVGRHAQLAMAERAAATRPPAAPESPNVLFIVLDTVRAKSLSLHGYARATSPRIDRMARSGVAFGHARSTAPWTLPSHASMFTGRYPHELFDYPEQRLDSSVPTLAGYLGRNGYATAGFVANTYYCNTGFGLGQGFDHYEDFRERTDTSPAEVIRHSGLGRQLISMTSNGQPPVIDQAKDGDRINADFLAWLPTRQGRPFFAFLNYFDAHAPYSPPENSPYHFGIRPSNQADVATLKGWSSLTHTPPNPRDLDLARDAYDDCIAHLDAVLGRLFDELDRQGILKETLVIITSDHGEELGEHGLVGHGRSLYGEELHVPLMIVKPGLVPSGKVVTEPVSLRDLPSTVVDLLGLAGRSPFPGRSMTPSWTGKPAEAGVVFSEVALRDTVSKNGGRPPALRGPMSSVVAEGMVYILNSDGREELYRKANDPNEAHDLAAVEAERPTLERLRSLAEKFRVSNQ